MQPTEVQLNTMNLCPSEFSKGISCTTMSIASTELVTAKQIKVHQLSTTTTQVRLNSDNDISIHKLHAHAQG